MLDKSVVEKRKKKGREKVDEQMKSRLQSMPWTEGNQRQRPVEQGKERVNKNGLSKGSVERFYRFLEMVRILFFFF